MGISLNPSSILSGQGIDVSSLVQQMITEQSGPMIEWQNEEATVQSQSVALTAINNDLSDLATAMQTLADPLGPFTASAAQSSDTSVLTATSENSAAVGSHEIVVNNLATAGALYTNGVSDPTASILPAGATGGDIQLQVGGSSGNTYDIQITPGSNDTLNTLASSINAQSSAGNWGVTASVVQDSTGYRLALYSQNTGSAGALALNTTLSNSNTTTLTFNAPVGGTDASLTIDGVPFTSSSNTLSGAIPGVTLNLLSAAPNSPVQLTVGPDQNQITTAVNNFVSAYNTVIADINTQYQVNPVTNNEGPLGGDPSLRSLQSSLLSDAGYSLDLNSNSGYVNLASLGIITNDDGTLSVVTSPTATQASFAQALAANPTAVQNFFQNASGTGFATNFNNDLTNLTDPTQGVLNVDLAQNQTTIQNLQTNVTNFQTQLTAQQQQLTAQFDAVNASLQAYPLLLEQTTEILGSLDSTGSTDTTSNSIPTLTSGL